MKALLVALAVLISAANMKSCNNKTKNENVKEIIIDANMAVAPKKDETVKLTAKIKKNSPIMELTVEYFGCKDDEFDLVFNKMWMKSMPPKGILFLKKTPGNCESKKNYTKKYLFNLKNVQYSASDNVLLKIKNYTEYFKYSYGQ